MNDNIRRTCTPKEYIYELFKDTKDGELLIIDDYFEECPRARFYEMCWTKEDMEAIVDRYEKLSLALERLGKLESELEDEAKRKELLSEEELEVWNIYVRPYEGFDFDEANIWELSEKQELGQLTKEEKQILNRYYQWREDESRKRIPFCRRSAEKMIIRARRYAKLISLNAPKIVIDEEGRCLAAEMVVYYGAKAESQE